MNTIREIERLNKLELENVVPPSASWHTDYRSTAYVHISGLAFTLTEGDILTIFSQFGEPTYLHLARDKDSGKSRGFAWLKYEDQRSTDLAVDNLGGATVMGRILKVDHTNYKRKEGEDEEEEARRELRAGEGVKGGEESDGEEVDGQRRELLREEVELIKLEREHDEDDPMKEYIVREKKEEISRALERVEKEARKHRHHHRKHHHHRRDSRDEGEERDRRRKRSRDGGGKTVESERRHHRRRRSRSP